MLKLLYTQADSGLAARLDADLRREGYDFAAGKPILIPLLSPAALNDAALNAEIVAALDRGQYIIPVIAAPLEMPHLIDHLAVADFSGGYDLDALKALLDAAHAPDARLPMRVLTPSRRAANRTAGLVVVAIVLVMFVVGLYAVGVLGIQMPQEEYNAVDTEAAATINAIVGPELEQYARFLPRSTEEAANYAATLRAVPTVYRPLMERTATAYAQGTFVPTPGAPAEATPEVTDGG